MNINEKFFYVAHFLRDGFTIEWLHYDPHHCRGKVETWKDSIKVASKYKTRKGAVNARQCIADRNRQISNIRPELFIVCWEEPKLNNDDNETGEYK